jgi:hypothetical protein
MFAFKRNIGIIMEIFKLKVIYWSAYGKTDPDPLDGASVI